MFEMSLNELGIMSHPTRVRGLKFIINSSSLIVNDVAPYTGAWIEII